MRDIRDFFVSTPSTIGAADINAATAQMAADRGGTLYLPGELDYETDHTVVLRSLIHITGDEPGMFDTKTGVASGTVLRLAPGANCAMMAAEAPTSHHFGVSHMGLYGNRKAQALDDGTHATDFPGIHLGLSGSVQAMFTAAPGMGSGDHGCSFHDLHIRDVAGTGLVVEAARESAFDNISIWGSRRYGLRAASVDSRWSRVVTATSDWIGAMFSSKGGTCRFDNFKSWFSGVKSFEEWAAYREYVRANGTGSIYFAPPDYLDTPWGCDFSIRTAACFYRGFQFQDSDGTGAFVNTSGSVVDLMSDSAGNLYKASGGASGGLLQGDGIRTAPTPAKRRHVIMAGCNRVQLTLNARNRVPPALTEHVIEFIGANTGCTVNGVHDGSFTVSPTKGATTSQVTLTP